MIRIHKSSEAPLSLRGLLPPRSGREIDTRLCTCADVKEQLLEEQHGKCAYCECMLTGDLGHIEHFRPKRGFTTSAHRKLQKPGYYWLAYEWKNILLSCSKCNTVYKKNRFELRDEKGRDIEHEDTSREEPLLINPMEENPEDFIEFRGYTAFPRVVGGRPSDKGVYTIETLKLNARRELVARRRERWMEHARLERIARIAERELGKDPENKNMRVIRRTTRKILEDMASPETEFSAMFRQREEGGIRRRRGRRGGGSGGSGSSGAPAYVS